ncbi:MAG: ParB/RepB/Spo0J family partition protein [Thaumarchaeota archaeon]|nr:ParB/RepB/Spo0J family partition protein [Nitrososphaerota archaeon]
MSEVPLSQIEGNELRLASGNSTDDLESSLSTLGQLSPIRVKPSTTNKSRYEVVFGNRRLRAARKLGWSSIKAEIVDTSESDALLMAFIENCDREDFRDYEKGLLLEKIHRTTGNSYTRIAEMIGRSSAYVSQHVAMLNLFDAAVSDESEQKKVLSLLTEKHARLLAQIEDPAERWNTAKLVVRANIGVRELERICSRLCTKSKSRERNSIREITPVVSSIIKGLSTNDIRPFSELLSKRHFTMFSSFGKFSAMDAEEALKHICATIGGMSNWRQRIEHLDVRTCGKFAYAVMIIEHEMTTSSRKLKTRTRATIIFENEDGMWKVVHGHWSSVDARAAIELPSISR